MSAPQGTETAGRPRLFDGARPGLLARTEPKVRAAGLAALLTPLLLFYVDRAPGVSALPGWAVPLVDAVVTGGLVWAAGYAVRAVDRVDLFATATGARVDELAREHLPAQLVDQLETWVEDLAHAGEDILGEAASAAEVAAQVGEDPLVAARHSPAVLAALEALRGAGTSPLEAVTREIPLLPPPPLVAPGEAGPAGSDGSPGLP